MRRVVRLAFRLASERKKRVTSIDKANVLESSRLWRQTATAVAAEFPVGDAGASARRFGGHAPGDHAGAAYDVVVTENMFGDILTDEASVLAGSLGLLPSASLGDARVGLYEPIHGSAPDIANRGIANPLGTIASAALLLRHSLGAPASAARIERAIDRALADGLRTADLGGTLGTDELTRAVVERL